MMKNDDVVLVSTYDVISPCRVEFDKAVWIGPRHVANKLSERLIRDPRFQRSKNLRLEIKDVKPFTLHTVRMMKRGIDERLNSPAPGSDNEEDSDVFLLTSLAESSAYKWASAAKAKAGEMSCDSDSRGANATEIPPKGLTVDDAPKSLPSDEGRDKGAQRLSLDEGRKKSARVKVRAAVTGRKAKPPKTQRETPISNHAKMSAPELALEFRLPANALHLRLKRWRENHDGGWIENPLRHGRDATFLYEVGAVKRVIKDLQAKTCANTKRTSRKN